MRLFWLNCSLVLCLVGSSYANWKTCKFEGYNFLEWIVLLEKNTYKNCFGYVEVTAPLGSHNGNHAVIFRDVYKGNIKTIKKIVKHLREKGVVQTYIGGFDTEGKNAIYLNNDQCYPIPEYIYYVVVKGMEVLVFVTLNEPRAKGYDGERPFCENKCAKACIEEPQFSKYASGFTICCSLGNFKKMFREKLKSELQFPSDLSNVKLLKVTTFDANEHEGNEITQLYNNNNCPKVYDELLQKRLNINLLSNAL